MTSFVEEVLEAYVQHSVVYFRNGIAYVLSPDTSMVYQLKEHTPTASGYFKTEYFRGRLFVTSTNKIRAIKPSDLVAKQLGR